MTLHGGAIAALVATLVTLVGCGSSQTANPSSTASSSVEATPTTAPPDVMTPIVGAVPFPPVPFAGSDGRSHLVYELSLTNFTGAPAVVEALRIVDQNGDPVGQLDAAAVRGRLQPAGTRDNSDRLEAGQSGTIFLHVVLDADAPIPATVTHEITATVEAMPPEINRPTMTLATTRVDDRTLPVLGAPLRGERYIAADGCCDAVRHTRAILPVNGRLFVAQRYAIDYEQADSGNRIYTGDASDPDNYVIFGKDVLAVADGMVVGTRNDLPEQTPGTYPAGIQVDEADGNFVVLDIGDGFFVNYAHMQPGSVRPEVGDRVAKGDVIGLVGNTGNSVAPHLHLHVMDGPSPLAAQGLPYLYDKFAITGQVASTADFDAAEGEGVPLVLAPGADVTEHSDQLILDQNIVTFKP
jgi:Peptidase family M23